MPRIHDLNIATACVVQNTAKQYKIVAVSEFSTKKCPEFGFREMSDYVKEFWQVLA